MRALLPPSIFLLLLAPAWAGDEPAPPDAAPAFTALDFAQVPRTPPKEPTYVAAPRYALFVFGPAGTMRVWAVLDKSKADLAYYDVLYFDRNGDGDLTQEGERFTARFSEKGAAAGMAVVLRVGKLPVPGTDLVHEDLIVSTVRKKGRQGIWFRMRYDGGTQVSGGQTTHGDTTRWGASPAEAPILRPTVRGPLAFGLYGWGARDVRLTIGEAKKVYLVLGNRGSGADTLCCVDEEFLDLERDRITATLIAKDADGREVRSENAIRGHC